MAILDKDFKERIEAAGGSVVEFKDPDDKNTAMVGLDRSGFLRTEDGRFVVDGDRRPLVDHGKSYRGNQHAEFQEEMREYAEKRGANIAFGSELGAPESEDMLTGLMEDLYGQYGDGEVQNAVTFVREHGLRALYETQVKMGIVEEALKLGLEAENERSYRDAIETALPIIRDLIEWEKNKATFPWEERRERPKIAEDLDDGEFPL